MNFRFVATLMFTLAGSLHAALPLREGESFTYKVSWAILPGAGEIKIVADTDRSGPSPRPRLTTTTQTRGIARALLSFNATAESFFDTESGRLGTHIESVQQSSKRSAHSVAFDYAAAQAVYTRTAPAEAPRALPMPAGEPLDLITCLVQTRTWDLKPGEKRDALVLFDDEFYELTLHAARYEKLRTNFGTLNTLVLEPRMEKTAPKGMFKKGSTVRVWISQDERRLPVRFEVEFKIGTGVATLTHHELPPAAPAPDAKNPRP